MNASTIFHILKSLKSDNTRQLDEFNYSLGISSCAKSTMWQHALGLFWDMPEAKVPRAHSGKHLSLEPIRHSKKLSLDPELREQWSFTHHEIYETVNLDL